MGAYLDPKYDKKFSEANRDLALKIIRGLTSSGYEIKRLIRK